jgi:hypothetical protein
MQCDGVASRGEDELKPMQCDGVASGGEDELKPMTHKWEVFLHSWMQFESATEDLIFAAEAAGKKKVGYSARGQNYVIDLDDMAQINKRTGVSRKIRRFEEGSADSVAAPQSCNPPSRTARLTSLVETLLSPAVQLQLPGEASEEAARLSAEEVRQLFIKHVPGVQKFLYRELSGQYALEFIVSAYLNGIQAFAGTELHNHLLWLMRSIVHEAADDKPGASRHLREVAEAFMDCQAVQARVVERVGLELKGIGGDFPGLVKDFLGIYKRIAIKMLAHEHIARHLVSDDGNPTHYENRLAADLGNRIGLNEDDVRRAVLDEHAKVRFSKLQGNSLEEAIGCCRRLFDIEALMNALASELNSFSAASPSGSMSCRFLDWAAENLAQKHIVFDEETCSRVDVDTQFVLAMLEALFAGIHDSEETYRGLPLRELFKQPPN